MAASAPAAAATPAAPAAGTSPPRAAPARPRVDALEHRRVLQHVRDDQETNLAASDVDVLQLVHTAVFARVRDALELAVPVVLRLDQRAPVRVARLELDLLKRIEGVGGQRRVEGSAGGSDRPPDWLALGFSPLQRFRAGSRETRVTRPSRARGRRGVNAGCRGYTYRHGMPLRLVEKLDGDADTLAETGRHCSVSDFPVSPSTSANRRLPGSMCDPRIDDASVRVTLPDNTDVRTLYACFGVACSCSLL